MHMAEMLLVLTVAMLAGTTRGDDRLDFPKPPEGYEWTRLDEARAGFLRPKGWHVKSETSNGTHALFISREQIRDGGTFETGLTVNVVNAGRDRDPVEYAKKYLAGMAEKGQATQKTQLSC